MRRWLGTIAVGLALVVGGFGVRVQAQDTLSAQVLRLLTRINNWTTTNTYYDLRIASQAIPSVTTYRIYADASGNLYFNGGLIAGAGGGVTPHNLLSTTHTDTLAASAVRGSVVVANSTPKWAAVTLCTSGYYLGSDGTDTLCRNNGSALTNLSAAQLSGTASAFDGNAITNLNATQLLTGTVPLARLSAITNTQISASAAIAYSKLALTGSVVNADVSASAAIAYSKLALTGSIVTGDLASATLLFNRWASNSCTNLQVPQYNGSAWVCKSLVTSDVTGAGTVSSVAMTAPGIFSVAGTPITTSGTLAVTLATQAANLIWGGPASGAAAAPTFRALVNADLPLSGVAAATYPKVTVNTRGVVTAASASIDLTADVGVTILPRANGGTGVAVSADDTLLIGSGAAWVAQTLPNCPAGALQYTAATNSFACATTGGPTHDVLSATHTDTLAAAVVRGDMIVGNSTPAWARVAKGSAGQLWSMGATDPSWSATVAAGTITSSTPWTWTQTWNAGGVTFTGWLVNITSTASAAASLIADLQVGGNSQWKVDKTGNVTQVGNLLAFTAGTPTVGSNALPFGSLYLGTAATNNLAITPAAFAQATIATVDNPALAAVKLPLVRRGTVAFVSGAIGPGACAAAVTATVTGLATTATVVASLNAAPQTNWQTGVTFFAYPTADTVNVRVCNPTAGSLTPESTTLNWTAVVP